MYIFLANSNFVNKVDFISVWIVVMSHKCIPQLFCLLVKMPEPIRITDLLEYSLIKKLKTLVTPLLLSSGCWAVWRPEEARGPVQHVGPRRQSAVRLHQHTQAEVHPSGLTDVSSWYRKTIVLPMHEELITYNVIHVTPQHSVECENNWFSETENKM